MIICLLGQQISMLALLSVKRFKFSALLIPLIIATILYWRHINAHFKRPLKLSALKDAARLDKFEAEEDTLLDDKELMEREKEVSCLYLSPCFKVDSGEYEQLLAEVAKCQARMNGGNSLEAAEGGVSEEHHEEELEEKLEDENTEVVPDSLAKAK